MMKNKVECDVFYYKGNYLIEQPRETKIYNRLYINGIGLVAYCKRRSLLIEIICILIIILNIINLIVYPALSTKVYIPEHFNYYDGKLYTNIVSDETNKNRVILYVLGSKYIIEPGDRVYSINTNQLILYFYFILYSQPDSLQYSQLQVIQVFLPITWLYFLVK